MQTTALEQCAVAAEMPPKQQKTVVCAFAEGGVGCANAAVHRVTQKQLQNACDPAQNPRAVNELPLSYEKPSSGSPFVCGDHLFDVLKPGVDDAYKKASSDGYSLVRRDLVKGVFKAVGTHEKHHGPGATGACCGARGIGRRRHGVRVQL